MHPADHCVDIIIDGVIGHVNRSEFNSVLQFSVLGVVVEHMNDAGEQIEF